MLVFDLKISAEILTQHQGNSSIVKLKQGKSRSLSAVFIETIIASSNLKIFPERELEMF